MNKSLFLFDRVNLYFSSRFCCTNQFCRKERKRIKSREEHTIRKHKAITRKSLTRIKQKGFSWNWVLAENAFIKELLAKEAYLQNGFSIVFVEDELLLIKRIESSSRQSSSCFCDALSVFPHVDFYVCCCQAWHEQKEERWWWLSNRMQNRRWKQESSSTYHNNRIPLKTKNAHLEEFEIVVWPWGFELGWLRLQCCPFSRRCLVGCLHSWRKRELVFPPTVQGRVLLRRPRRLPRLAVSSQGPNCLLWCFLLRRRRQTRPAWRDVSPHQERLPHSDEPRRKWLFSFGNRVSSSFLLLDIMALVWWKNKNKRQ